MSKTNSHIHFQTYSDSDMNEVQIRICPRNDKGSVHWFN